MEARHAIPISGKDSLATAIVSKQLYPNIKFEYFFNDTGKEYPVTLDWLARVESTLGITITRIGADLEEIILEEGILPSHQKRFCTRLGKITPMADFFGPDQVFIYYGIRADENRAGLRPIAGTDLTAVYPLQELGLGLNEVWYIVRKAGLKPPTFFWPQLHDQVKNMLGANAGWLEGLTEYEFDLLFTGRTRPNCSFCFYQALWEIVWCLEVYPEIFWHNAEFEKEVGGKEYTSRQNNSYYRLAERAGEIRTKRAKKVLEAIVQKATTGLFSQAGEDDIFPALLKTTSCGVLCGK